MFSSARTLLHLSSENGFGALAGLFVESPSTEQLILLEEFEGANMGMWVFTETHEGKTSLNYL